MQDIPLEGLIFARHIGACGKALVSSICPKADDLRFSALDIAALTAVAGGIYARYGGFHTGIYKNSPVYPDTGISSQAGVCAGSQNITRLNQPKPQSHRKIPHQPWNCLYGLPSGRHGILRKFPFAAKASSIRAAVAG